MSEKLRILFVDDEETFLYSTADLLRCAGYECECAGAVEAAHEALARQTYDLMITDLRMPGNSELEFVRQAASLAEGMSIILVTGYPSLASAVQSIELPIVAYLVKPFEFGQLLAKVRQVEQHAELNRVVRAELGRLDEYRHALAQVNARLQLQPRPAQGACLDALVSMTLANITESLTNVRSLLNGESSAEAPAADALGPAGEDLRDVLYDAVATLERTKSAFKSKELGELRRRLQGLLKSAASLR